MSTVVDTIAAIVRRELAALRITELALVDAVHPHRVAGDDDNYGVDVTLRNSGLALKRVPLTTDRIGTVAVPNVGDLVLLAFDQGDLNHPVVIGRLYNEIDRPPTSTTDEVVFRLPLAGSDDRSVLAAVRNHADADPRRELVVEMPPKITVRVVDGVVSATAGSTKLTLDQSGSSGGTVTVTAGTTTLTLNQDGDVVLDCPADVTLRAAGDLTLTAGGDVSVEAGRNATVRAGLRATVQASVTAALVGSAEAQVQGGTVSIHGMTTFGP